MPQHIHRLHQGMLIIQHTPSNHPQRTLVPDHRTGQPFAPDELYAVAERINPKRAYLFVSKILSRHIPQPINHPPSPPPTNRSPKRSANISPASHRPTQPRQAAS